MLKIINENGEMINVQGTSEGAIKVNVNNEEAIKVQVEGEGEKKETTKYANLLTVGTTSSSISVNSEVTAIEIANYSETATVTLSVGTQDFVIGNSIATSLPINKEIENISIVSSEADTSVQLVVKGVD